MLDLTGVHNSQSCTLGADGGPCDACAWANGVEASRCVLHPDVRATYTVQGIPVCDADYQTYRAEYASGSNTQLVSRPFLQRLIQASAELS